MSIIPAHLLAPDHGAPPLTMDTHGRVTCTVVASSGTLVPWVMAIEDLDGITPDSGGCTLSLLSEAEVWVANPLQHWIDLRDHLAAGKAPDKGFVLTILDACLAEHEGGS